MGSNEDANAKIQDANRDVERDDKAGRSTRNLWICDERAVWEIS